MVIITKVFIINENVYHSLILLVWGYLLIYNMQELSHYKKNGVYVPFSVRLPCGDLCWEKPKQEEGNGLAVSRHALNVIM